MAETKLLPLRRRPNCCPYLSFCSYHPLESDTCMMVSYYFCCLFSLGVILRPGFIHGTRRVGSVKLPLSVVGAPMEMVRFLFPHLFQFM